MTSRATAMTYPSARPGRTEAPDPAGPAEESGPPGADEHRDADGGAGQRQQRRQVGERQAGGRGQRVPEGLREDQPHAVEQGGRGEPPVAPRDGALVPAGAEPTAGRRGEPGQHAKHAHTWSPEVFRRTRAPSVPLAGSFLVNARWPWIDGCLTRSLLRRNE